MSYPFGMELPVAIGIAVGVALSVIALLVLLDLVAFFQIFG
jgi:hypothetical protein